MPMKEFFATLGDLPVGHRFRFDGGVPGNYPYIRTVKGYRSTLSKDGPHDVKRPKGTEILTGTFAATPQAAKRELHALRDAKVGTYYGGERVEKNPPDDEGGYNGWTNYETWNVALWIGNDEGLYSFAKEYRRSRNPYKDFREALEEMGGGEISFRTPDGVAWNDSGLDLAELDAMIREL